jgi:ABC-2 type transport system permease protein
VSAVPVELPLAPDAREMHGPSAFGGSARRFLDLTWMMAVTEFRLSYFGSVLGYLWSLMRPLMFFGVLYLVFSKILKFGGDIRHYPEVLLMNIVLFNFFSEATGQAVTAVVAREAMVRKMHFPRMVIPLATVLTSAFNLLLNLLAVFVFIIASGVSPRADWLLLPIVLVALVIFTTGVAMILSSLYVRFRDVQPIWTVLSQLLFYGTPIIYTIDKLRNEGSATAAKLVMINPLADLLEQARRWVVDAHAQGAPYAIGGWLNFLAPVAIAVGIVALGVWTFARQAPRIAEEL